MARSLTVRHPSLLAAARVAAVLLVLSVVSRCAAAQVTDTTRGPRPVPTLTLPRGDATPPITPRRAFFYSLFVPGSAQSILDRPTAGSIFVSIEAGSIVMLAKSRNDLRAARSLARDSVVDSIIVKPVTPTTSDTIYKRSLPAGAARAKSRIGPRRLHVEDWTTLIIVNHFLAGADAYVAANLWDVPADVKVSVAPEGGMLLVASLRW